VRHSRIIALLCLLAGGLAAQWAEAAEERKRFHSNTPRWMQNVASIEIPAIKIEGSRARHYLEYCSGTLLRDNGALRRRYMISAWHCVEHYQDLSKALRVRFPHSSVTKLEYQARLIDSGGAIDRDWAVLELSTAPTPEQLEGLPVLTTDPSTAATAVGFALALENGRNELSYDDSCRMRDDIHWANCTTSKGSSGGPIVQTKEGAIGVVGVISQGDSQALTITYPISKLPTRWRIKFQSSVL